MPHTAAAVADCFVTALAAAAYRDRPFSHWQLRQVLPDGLAGAIAGLAIDRPRDMVFSGRRETNNSARIYFNGALRSRFPAVQALADAFQSPAVVGTLAAICQAKLGGANLRMEYCLDTEGFWLEPHTDIGAKRLTMMVYLTAGEGPWGTDLYDQQQRWQSTAPSPFNSGLIFIPATDTWHGLERRPIHDVRRSLMINYVGPEWRAREELAFPESPVELAIQ